MIELECFLIQVLMEGGPRGAPFSLQEIACCLDEVCGDRTVTYQSVRRVYLKLFNNPNTRHEVKPLKGGGRELLFDAPAARRIARRVLRGKLPKLIDKARRLDPTLLPKYDHVPKYDQANKSLHIEPLHKDYPQHSLKFSPQDEKRHLSDTKVKKAIAR